MELEYFTEPVSDTPVLFTDSRLEVLADFYLQCSWGAKMKKQSRIEQVVVILTIICEFPSTLFTYFCQQVCIPVRY